MTEPQEDSNDIQRELPPVQKRQREMALLKEECDREHTPYPDELKEFIAEIRGIK